VSVRAETSDGVAVVTLDDPDRRNVLSGSMVDGIVAAFDELEADGSTAAVVVTGAGRGFCAGADLGSLDSAVSGDAAGVRNIYEGFLRVARSPLVTIAAVNGAAVGAGMNLALACDIRVAGRSARFDTRFLQLGLHPGGGHVWMLERAVGPQAAAALLLCGEVLDGEAAAAAGLAWRCVDDDALLDSARQLAAGAASVSLPLLRRAKATLRAAPGLSTHAEAVAMELDAQMWSAQQPAFKERLAAMQARVTGPKP
jgi:enoyl-CoA hydratase